MVRFALALAAIVVLILSARLTHGQLPKTPLRASTISTAVFQNNTDAFRAELMPLRRATPIRIAQRSPNAEPPAPALLIYLGLILVGGAGAVALARWRLHGES